MKLETIFIEIALDQVLNDQLEQSKSKAYEAAQHIDKVLSSINPNTDGLKPDNLIKGYQDLISVQKETIKTHQELRREFQNPFTLNVDSSSVQRAIADTRTLKEELRQATNVASINTQITHTVQHQVSIDGRSASSEIQNAMTEGGRVVHDSIISAYRKMPRQGGGGFNPFGIPMRVAQDTITGVGYALGSRVVGGISAPFDRALQDIGGRIEKYATDRAKEYAVFISRTAGFRNTSEAKEAINKAADAVDFLYSPRRQEAAYRQNRERVIKSAQEAVKNKTSFFDELSKEYQEETEAIKNEVAKALGQGTRAVVQPALSSALQANKEINYARQVEQVQTRSSGVNVDPRILEQAMKTGNLTIISPGSHHADGEGGQKIADQVAQIAPNSAMVVGKNKDVDAANKDFSKLLAAAEKLIGDTTMVQNLIDRAKAGGTGAEGALKFLENQLLGSEDAVSQAAIAQAYRDAGFKGNVNFLGYSSGSATAYDATQLMQMLGADAKGYGIGGLITGLGQAPRQNFTQIQGSYDWIPLALRGEFDKVLSRKSGSDPLIDSLLGMAGDVPLPFLSSVSPRTQKGTAYFQGVGMGHDFAEYLSSPQVQGMFDPSRGFAPNYTFQGRRGAFSLRAEKELRRTSILDMFPNMPKDGELQDAPESSDITALEKKLKGIKKYAKGRMADEVEIIIEQLDVLKKALDPWETDQYFEYLDKVRSLEKKRESIHEQNPTVFQGYKVESPTPKMENYTLPNYVVESPKVDFTNDTELYPKPEPPSTIEKLQEKKAQLIGFVDNVKDSTNALVNFSKAVYDAGKTVRSKHDSAVDKLYKLEDKLSFGQAKNVRGKLGEYWGNMWGVEYTPYRPMDGTQTGGLARTGNVFRQGYNALKRGEEWLFDKDPLGLPYATKTAMQWGGGLFAANAIAPSALGGVFDAAGSLGNAAGTGVGQALTEYIIQLLPDALVNGLSSLTNAPMIGEGVQSILQGGSEVLPSLLGAGGSATAVGGAALFTGHGTSKLLRSGTDFLAPGNLQLEQSGNKAGQKMLGAAQKALNKGIEKATNELKPATNVTAEIEGADEFLALPATSEIKKTGEAISDLRERIDRIVLSKKRLQENYGLSISNLDAIGYNPKSSQDLYNTFNAWGQSEDELDKMRKAKRAAQDQGYDYEFITSNDFQKDVGTFKKRAQDALLKAAPGIKEAAKLGDQTAQGFINAIKDSEPEVRKVANKKGLAFFDSLKKALDIRSPSRKTFWAGVQTVVGYLKGLDSENVGKKAKEIGQQAADGLAYSVEEVKKGYGKLLGYSEKYGVTNAAKTAGKAGTGFLGGFSEEFDKLKQAVPLLGKLQTALPAIAGGTLAALFGDDLLRAVNNIAEVNDEQEALKLSLDAVIQTDADQFYSDMATQADRLGVSLSNTQTTARALEASLVNTSLEGQSLDLLKGFQATFARFGSSTEQQSRTLLGLQQSAQLGRVALEELKQMAESTPGVMQAAADSYNVTTKELFRMVTAGEILAEDLLPRLSKALEQRSGVTGFVDTPRASMARFNNEVLLFQDNIGDVPSAIRKAGFDTATSGIKFLNQNMDTLQDMALAVSIVLGLKFAASLVMSAKSAIQAAGGIGAVMKTIQGMSPVLASATPLLLAFGAAYAGIAAYKHINRVYDSVKPIKALNEELKTFLNTSQAIDSSGKAKPQDPDRYVNPKQLAYDRGEFVREKTQYLKEAKKAQEDLNFSLESSKSAVEDLLKNETKLNRLKAIDKEITAEIAKQRILSAEGDTEQAAKVQRRIIELRKEQTNLTKGDFDKAIGDLSTVEQQLNSRIEAAEALEKSDPQLFQSVREVIPIYEQMRDTAKETREQLQGASQVEYENLQKATFELQKQLNLIDQQGAIDQQNSARNRSRIIGKYGLGQKGQALEQRDLNAQNLADLQKEFSRVTEKLGLINDATPDAKELQSLSDALAKQGVNNIDTATQEQLNTAIASLGDAASDTLKNYASSISQRPGLLAQQGQLQEQIAQTRKSNQQQILEATNAQIDFYRQSAQQARELRKSVKDYDRQLTRQLEDTRQAIKRETSELKSLRLANEIRSRLDSVTGDFAGQMTGYIEGFFEQISQFTQNKLDAEAQAFGLSRSMDDLIYGNQQFNSQIYQQKQSISDAQANYQGLPRQEVKRSRHTINVGSWNDASGEPGSDFTIHDANDRVIGVPVSLPIPAEVLMVNQQKGGYGKVVDVRVSYEGQPMDIRLAHFDELSNLQPGQMLPPGALLGTQGRSGNTSGGWYGSKYPGSDVGTHVSADFYRPNSHTGIPNSTRHRFLEEVWFPYLKGNVGAVASPSTQSASTQSSGGRPQVRMTDTGMTNADGLKLFKVQVINATGRVLHEDIALSGKAGNQELKTAAQGTAGSNNPIPEGRYTIGQFENVPGGLSYSGQNIGPDWIGLQGSEGNRSGFGFHLDVDNIPGSAGCVVFTDPQAVQKVSEAVARAGARELVVDYGLGTVEGLAIQQGTNQSLSQLSINQNPKLLGANLNAQTQQLALAKEREKLLNEQTNIEIARNFKEAFKTGEQQIFQQSQQIRQGERDALQNQLTNTVQTPISQAIGERRLQLLDQGISTAEIEFGIEKLTNDFISFGEQIELAQDKLNEVSKDPNLSDENKQKYTDFIELLKGLRDQTQKTKQAEIERYNAIKEFTGEGVFNANLKQLFQSDIQNAEQIAEQIYSINPQNANRVNPTRIFGGIEAQFRDQRQTLAKYKTDLEITLKSVQEAVDAGMGEQYEEMAARLVDASNKVKEAEENLSPTVEALAKTLALMDEDARVRGENLSPVQNLQRLERDRLNKLAELYDSAGDPFPGNFIKRDTQRDALKADITSQIGNYELQIMKQIEILKSQGKDAPDYTPLTQIAGGDGLMDATLEINDFNEAVLEGVSTLELMQSAMDGLSPEELIAVYQRSIKALRDGKKLQEDLIEKTLPTFGRTVKESVGKAGGDAFVTFTDSIIEGKGVLRSFGDTFLSFGRTIVQTIQRIVAQKVTASILKAIGFSFAPKISSPTSAINNTGVFNAAYGERSVKAQSLPDDPMAIGLGAIEALKTERQMNGGKGVALYAVTEGERILSPRETQYVNALEANGIHAMVGNAYEGSNPSDYAYQVSGTAAGINLSMPFSYHASGGGGDLTAEAVAGLMPLLQQKVNVTVAETINHERRNQGLKSEN